MRKKSLSLINAESWVDKSALVRGCSPRRVERLRVRSEMDGGNGGGERDRKVTFFDLGRMVVHVESGEDGQWSEDGGGSGGVDGGCEGWGSGCVISGKGGVIGGS